MKKLLVALLLFIPMVTNAQRVVHIAPKALFSFAPLTSNYVHQSLSSAHTYVEAWRDEGSDMRLNISLDSLDWASKYYIAVVDTTLVPKLLAYLVADTAAVNDTMPLATAIYDFPKSRPFIAHFQHEANSIKRFFATPILTLDRAAAYKPAAPSDLSALFHNFQLASSGCSISIFAPVSSTATIPQHIYVETIAALLPYDNDIVVAQILGGELLSMLEKSVAVAYRTARTAKDVIVATGARPISIAGVNYQIDVTKPPLHRVVNHNIVPDSIYSVVTNSYTARHFPSAVIGNYKYLLVDYLRSAPTLRQVEKWTVIPQRWLIENLQNQ